jgi:hypothetical protein
MRYNAYLVTMNARIDQLVKSLLLKDSLEQCSLNEVEQFAERHPYFGAAQLLLTKKLQIENPARYPEQLQKTYLFFHNPLWVEQLLNDTGTAVIKKAAPPEKVADIPEQYSPAVETTSSGSIQPEQEIAPVLPQPAEQIVAVITDDKLQEESVHEKEAENIGDLQMLPEPAPLINPVSESFSGHEAAAGETPALKAEEAAGELELSGNLNVQEPEKNEFNPGMPDAAGNSELLFEPYHTVDYFASQGIKIREEDLPKDKFSQQLKSFTGWLRTLKKLPAADFAPATISVAEHKVEQLAEHSLQEGDVFTEAMAEVWEKQGNYPKAIETYRKLSLLEPAKSTYFAAKIEELKKSN